MSRNPQIDRIRRLVADGLYPIDEGAVAEAIIARAMLRTQVAGVAWRNDVRPAEAAPVERPPARVRSFRPASGARSFHLTVRRPS
jgi:hypothetical protein